MDKSAAVVASRRAVVEGWVGIDSRGESMKRLLVALVVLIASSAGSAAYAAPGDSLNAKLSGPAVGSAPFDSVGCFPHQQYIVTVDTAGPHDASLVVEVCVSLSGQPFTATGTFMLTRGHATLAGTAACLVGEQSTQSTLSVRCTLTVASGTRSLKHVAGTLFLDSVWESDGMLGGPLIGTLTASVT
jgi:hypothetical protein